MARWFSGLQRRHEWYVPYAVPQGMSSSHKPWRVRWAFPLGDGEPGPGVQAHARALIEACIMHEAECSITHIYLYCAGPWRSGWKQKYFPGIEKLSKPVRLRRLESVSYWYWGGVGLSVYQTCRQNGPRWLPLLVHFCGHRWQNYNDDLLPLGSCSFRFFINNFASDKSYQLPWLLFFKVNKGIRNKTKPSSDPKLTNCWVFVKLQVRSWIGFHISNQSFLQG